MGRVRYPWHRGGKPESVYPIEGEGKILDDTRPVVITGITDQDGILRSTIPGDVRLAYVLTPRDYGPVVSGSVAAGAIVVLPEIIPDEVWMWSDKLIVEIESDLDMAGGDMDVAICSGPLGGAPPDAPVVQSLIYRYGGRDNNTMVLPQAEILTGGGGQKLRFVFVGMRGLTEVLIRVKNGNAAAREFIIYYRVL